MGEKIKGTVKWFSNRKGFGFITPTSDNSPTKEDIFVHQSNIVTDAEYRTLKDGFEVEFEAVKDENDKLKAENVTAADGTSCPGPEPRERRNRNRKKKGGAADDENGEEAVAETGDEAGGEKTDAGADANEKEGGKGGRKNRRRRKNGKKTEDEGAEGAAAAPKPKPAPKPTWYSELDESVKTAMEANGIKVDGGRAFVAIGDARVKIGTTGYAAMAHTNGIIAEGTYTCEKDGIVKPTWVKVLKFDGEWKASDATEQKDVLVGDINLSDDTVKPTGGEETPESLWGEGKIDPKEALESNGFQMRKVALHAAPGGGRRRGRGRRNNGRNGKKTNGEAQPAEAPKE
mmetsp:Transcript_130647/g.194631  ORF Transcript_130647/g.194631 Transcript_130647/m.194631 type:complete len:345 (+) Transcript_130647:56-1090(+)|eukprot:CAMPEP_0117042016 /NCGR_PEP_ID=MMETSP0472-20121206/29293_1 /TAXON_ID=693140 ORGANISM="Tiarina fusus, Strain LIS" /NCGR_SAMPLE_ID=MMETSP0472 /ASSEMBLY_ACC=CAM_ASM_000603 /LENGTH=344 /DNA_ID=CAMNT_0004753157 /DNA_START=48 /DNA_END=1082 /DNA_ORIENTATION=-